ncbi:MAG: hypothetical protein Q7J80_07795 [Anaerolineales bacterium]|nr:hypothetical protein [Anaerolineales bacterium]
MRLWRGFFGISGWSPTPPKPALTVRLAPRLTVSKGKADPNVAKELLVKALEEKRK